MRIGKMVAVALCAALISPASARQEEPWTKHQEAWTKRGQEMPDWVIPADTAVSWIHNDEVERLADGKVAYWMHTEFFKPQGRGGVYYLTRWELDCKGKARRTSQSGFDRDGIVVLTIDDAQDWFYARPNSNERGAQDVFCKEP